MSGAYAAATTGAATIPPRWAVSSSTPSCPTSSFSTRTLPEAVRIQNKLIDRGALNALTSNLYRLLTNDETAEVLDGIKDLGFRFATASGITIAINDIQVSPEKSLVMADTEERVDQYKTEYEVGLISEEERHAKIVDAWNQASFETADLVGSDLTNYGGIGVMALSGTKGNISQINQMAGMRGLVRRAGSAPTSSSCPSSPTSARA